MRAAPAPVIRCTATQLSLELANAGAAACVQMEDADGARLGSGAGYAQLPRQPLVEFGRRIAKPFVQYEVQQFDADRLHRVLVLIAEVAGQIPKSYSRPGTFL